MSSDVSVAGAPCGIMYVTLVPALDDEGTRGDRWDYVFMLSKKPIIKAMTVRVRTGAKGKTVLDVRDRNAGMIADVDTDNVIRALENFITAWKRSENMAEQELLRPKAKKVKKVENFLKKVIHASRSKEQARAKFTAAEVVSQRSLDTSRGA